MYTNGYTNWCIGHLSYIYKYNVFGHHVFHSVKLASKTLRRMRSLIETGLRGHPFRHGARGKLGLVREELPRVKGIRLREFAKPVTIGKPSAAILSSHPELDYLSKLIPRSMIWRIGLIGQYFL
jgi:hypothetical protein